MGECLRQEFSEKPWVWHHPARFQLLGDVGGQDRVPTAPTVATVAGVGRSIGRQ
jgi:hypothetical protein